MERDARCRQSPHGWKYPNAQRRIRFLTPPRKALMVREVPPSLPPLKANGLFKLMMKHSWCRGLKDEGVSVGFGGLQTPGDGWREHHQTPLCL